MSELQVLREFIDNPLPITFGERWDKLTPREKEVVNIDIFSEMDQRQSANTMGLAFSTYKNHLTSVYLKLGIGYGGRSRLTRRIIRKMLDRMEEALNGH